MASAREVTVLATGGTIGMAGAAGAVPSQAVAQLLERAGVMSSDVVADDVAQLPGAHLTLADVHRLSSRIAAAASKGHGVVVTHGTDTLEETAAIVHMFNQTDVPIVFTGAMRPAHHVSADGPSNLLDAIAVARSSHPDAADGVCVVFDGAIMAVPFVHKADSTSLRPFEAPPEAHLGVVIEGTAWWHRSPPRHRPSLTLPASLQSVRVPIVMTHLADDGSFLDQVLAWDPAGIVVAALGAGHLSIEMMQRVEQAAARIPAVVVVRPDRGRILTGTYGFRGSEGDVRTSGAAIAGGLSAPVARAMLLSALNVGLSVSEVRSIFRPYDRGGHLSGTS